jgi:phosphoenolpyruvate carboxykinase (ATP)
MKIAETRAMIKAALSGALDMVPYANDPVFNVDVPQACPGVPSEVLSPRTTWSDPAAYDVQAAKLAKMFIDNFRKLESEAGSGIDAAGPRV